MNLFTGGDPTLMGNTPAGGSLAQAQRRGHLAMSAGASLAQAAGPQGIAGQYDAERTARQLQATNEHALVQAQQTMQAEAAAAESLNRRAQETLMRHKTNAIRCCGAPHGNLVALAQMMGAA